jgi:hypothetical protein
MRNVLEEIAKEVVIDGRPNFRFDVDGVEFPWFISERGPIVTRIMDDLYAIDVEIIMLDKETKEVLPFGWTVIACSVPTVPIIGGVEFPWTCTDDEMVLRFCHKMFPTLSLKFCARNVSGDIAIDDQRMEREDPDVFCAGGDLIASSEKVN